MECTLITGASGFLGTNVVRTAKEKFKVISADLYPIEGWEIEKLDITGKERALYKIIQLNISKETVL